MAIRLVFEYDDNLMVLTNYQHVDMIVPASDPIRLSEHSYIDIINNHTVIYRRVLNVRHSEIFSPEKLANINLANSILVTVIPNVPEEGFVVLHYKGSDTFLELGEL